MIALALRGLVSRRLRAMLVCLAVFLGVAMIAGTFVLTDTIDAAFRQLFVAQTRGADVVVSARQADHAQFTRPQAFDAEILSQIRALSDVESAGGQVTDFASVVGKDGKILTMGGAPPIAVSFPPPGFTSIEIVQGKAPSGLNELVLDTETASRGNFKLGDQVKVATQKPIKSFQLVGLLTFGAGDVSIGSATFVAFDLATAQQLFDKPGELDVIYVAASEGVSANELARSIGAILPSDLQVRTAAEQVDADLEDIGQALSFITTGLLAFAFIAVFVGAFTIFNTFSITVAQRSRELGLLRAVGATRAQVLGSIIIEASVIAIVGSVLGVAGGFLFAIGVDALFEALGADLPSTNTVFETRTAIIALLCGIIVTLLAAIFPAVRASRVAPIQALQLAGIPQRSRAFRRLTAVLFSLVTLLGAAMVAVGLLSEGGDSTTKLVAAAGGAVVLVIGVSLLTPRFVRPAARVLGVPFERSTRVVGRLARENSERVPGRTAVSSATLMIGLTVILFVTIFANGVRASVNNIIEQRFAGDIAVLNENGFSPFPVRTAEAIEKVPGIDIVSVFQAGESEIEGVGQEFAIGVDTRTLTSVYNFDWIDGSIATLRELGASDTLLEEGVSKKADVGVGDNIVVRLPGGRTVSLTVRGIFKDTGILNGYVVNARTFERLFGDQPASLVLASVLPSENQKDVLRAANKALDPFPQARARSQQELQDENASQINQILSLFYALLALSVIIAMFGIVNTLTLSIHERTRELGLLRAVGMTRRDVRRMVRYESAITAAIGGALGLVLGLFFAFVVTEALSDEGIVFAVPVGQVIAFLALTVFVGVLAAILPARRAARLDVLTAIAQE